MDRRGFVRAVGGAACAVAVHRALELGSSMSWASSLGSRTLRLAFMAEEAVPNGDWGARFGAEEAAHAARMFGSTVEFTTASDTKALLRDYGPHALIGGFDEDRCRSLAKVAEERGVLFINTGCAADALRAPGCNRNTFHVAASNAMLRDAIAAAGDSSLTPDDAIMWDDSLERFGAGQVNARFRAQFDAGMDSTAWAGWFAVKTVAETWLRMNDGSIGEMVRRLEAQTTRFDGHKGRPLSFRSWDHQLRQPLYVRHRSAGGELTEVPDRDGGTAAEQLDKLGASEAEASCGWNR